MRKSLIYLPIFILFIITCLGFNPSKAINGHEFDDITFSLIPSTPVVGESAKLTINFDLKSSTGIDVNRIKIFINNSLLKYKASDFIVDKEDPKNASISFTLPAVIFTSTKNTITLKYLLTRSLDSIEQADFTFTVNATSSSSGGSDSGGNSGGGSGGGSGTTNGDTGTPVITVPRLFTIDVEEVSDDLGVVSSSPKQFRLTVEHNGDVLDFVDEDNYDGTVNPVIKNLKVTSKKTFASNKETLLVNEDIFFDLEKSSEVVEEDQGFYRTVYISDALELKQGQVLNFSLDLGKFLERSGIEFSSDIITKDSSKITIDPLKASFSSIALSDDSLDFSILSIDRKITMGSTGFNVLATTTGSGSLLPATVNAIEFSKKQAPKTAALRLDKGSRDRLKLSVEQNGDVIVSKSGSSTLITIPAQAFIETVKSKLNPKQKFTDSTKSKSLILPLSISASTSNGLEMIIRGAYNQTTQCNFDLDDLFVTNGETL